MEKIYAGTARMLATQFGTLPKVTFTGKDLNTLLDYLNENDTEFVSLNVKEKPQKVEGRPTHYLQVDDWKPGQGKEKKEFTPVVAKREIIEKNEKDVLPF